VDEFSYYEAAKSHGYYEDNRAFQRIASEASEVARREKLDPDQFEWGLHQLYDAYGSFLYGVNPNDHERKEQHAWYNHFRDARLGKKFGEPPLAQEMISGAAYTYLKGPLRVPTFDRSLIDAFIAQETFAYIDRHAGRSAMMTQFGCFSSALVVALIWDFFFGSPDWKGFKWAIGGMVAVMLVVWAWPKRGPFVLYRAMRDTYQLLSGSVVSVPELRRRVEEARVKGVVWPAELYAVLDDVEARTKVL
jgi:hypothetical protein